MTTDIREVVARPSGGERTILIDITAPAPRRISAALFFGKPWLEPSRLLWVLLLIGIAARLVRYLVCFPLWKDEAFLAVNFIGRGYADLLQPLDYEQICPALFLWIQLTIVKVLGYSEYTLRLFPCLCGLGSVGLFWHLSRRLFRGTAALLATGIFAGSYAMIRYSAEVKPSASDLLVSLGLLVLAVEWWRCRAQRRWLWALAAAVPIAIWLSNSGVAAALLPALASEKSAVKRRL